MQVRGWRSGVWVKVAVPPPAGTWGSESPRSDSSGSGPAPAAGVPPPGDRAGSADPSRPAPPLTPSPSFSPRSTGPGHVATGWRWPPCAGLWGRRPAGPCLRGGIPGAGALGQGWPGGSEGPGWAGMGAPHHSHKHQGSFQQGLGQEQQQEWERSGGVAPKPWPGHGRAARR